MESKVSRPLNMPPPATIASSHRGIALGVFVVVVESLS